MPTEHVNGTTINYRIEGDGPETVVLINGLADDLDTWAYQVPAWSPPTSGSFDSTIVVSEPATNRPARTPPGCSPTPPKAWSTGSKCASFTSWVCRWAAWWRSSTR